MSTAKWLLLILSLWVLWAIRAHNILILPAFVDESLHILRAQMVFEFKDPTASFLPGKLLTYYYLGLFDPQDHNGLWLSRQAIALLAPLSASLCFAVVKSMTRSFWAGMIAIWLYALTPFLVFFERMALADPFVAVFALGVVWSGYLLAQRPTYRRAAITGGLLGLAILVKLTALPLVAVPMMAILLFGRGKIDDMRGSKGLKPLVQKLNLKILFACYFVMGILLLPTFGYVIYQEAAQVEDKQEVVTTSLFVPENRSRLEQISFNLETYVKALVPLTLLNLALLLLMIIILLFMQRYLWEAGYLLIGIGLAWGFVLVTSAFPSTRYLTPAFPFWLIIMGLGAAVILSQFDLHNVVKWNFIGGALTVVSIPLVFNVVLFDLDFIEIVWNDPTEHQFGDQDEWEYITNSSSGYGLREAAPDILKLPNDGDIRLTAFVGNCHSLRLYFPENHNVDLACPFFKFNDTMIPAITAEWETKVREAGSWYFLVEDLGVFDFQRMKLQPEFIAAYDRPLNGIRVWLYRVTPAERGSDAWFK